MDSVYLDVVYSYKATFQTPNFLPDQDDRFWLVLLTSETTPVSLSITMCTHSSIAAPCGKHKKLIKNAGNYLCAEGKSIA